MRLNKVGYIVLLVVLLGFSVVFLSLPLAPIIGFAGIGTPNASVLTRVNITNSPPYVYNVSITNPISLSANSSVTIMCNATVRDYNNVSDINNVNATFFDINFSTSLAFDHNNTHYTNVSCDNFTDLNLFERRYNCMFSLWFNTNPGEFSCNVTARDTKYVQGSDNGTSTVNRLVALIVPDLLDYGQVDVANISMTKLLNISNAGNRLLNVSVFGYGRTENDSLAMVCDYGNISIANQRYNISNGSESDPVPFDTLYTVNNSNASAIQIPNFNIKQHNITQYDNINSTLWRLFVALGPVGTPSGICNGTLVFRAVGAN